jgi:hypothetical protein
VAASGSFSISYGDGSSVSGSYAYDTVAIAPLSATSQIFAQTTTAISGNFDVINFSTCYRRVVPVIYFFLF